MEVIVTVMFLFFWITLGMATFAMPYEAAGYKKACPPKLSHWVLTGAHAEVVVALLLP